MKKIFTLVIVSLFVGQTLAYDFKSGSLYYNITSDRTVEVTYQKWQSSDYSGRVNIPENVTYNGVTYLVTSIGESAFYNCTNLVSITIPNSVTNIENWAFNRCSSLTSITIPDGVTRIGNWVFNKCSGLKYITIGNSITSIGEVAFGDCKNLISITIPESVKRIGYEAFYGCSATIKCIASSQPSGWNDNWNYGHNGKVIWGYSYSNSFSFFAKEMVEKELNEWQKKGEFEKVADWEKRVTTETRYAKINQLTQKAEKTYIEKYADKTLTLSLETYDAENEVFLVKNLKYGNMLVPVPIKRAPQFKQQWSNIKKTPQYFIENDTISIAKVVFTMLDGSQYTYSNQASLNYEVAQVNYNFEPIDFNIQSSSSSATSKGNQSITTTKRTIGQSDIDVNIPVSNTQQNNTFAVIIANENYQKEAQVPFAVNDGRTFAEYCKKTLGIPNNNVHIVTDATLNNMKYEVRWLKQVIDAYGGEARVIFYYAGHGIPDEAQKTAYLLPIDGFGNDVSTGYKLDDLYSTLGNLPSKSVTVFLDACFSGANRNGEMLASARGVAIKAKSSAPVGNMVVFSAAQGDETAYPNNEQQHGMFTYYLLKKIKETSGNVTYKELGDYVTDNVRKQSIVVNGKSQTPVVVPSATVSGNWESWRLK
ncbi:MAG: leucine-rich repeat protein [Salinivirgaceae bacterium]|nr:leucine-rich repeat protein [Salinivirgaceae bacterium]